MRAIIPAKELKSVFVIPREYMSGLNQVLLIRDGKFKRLDITPIWSGTETIVTRDGILEGDHIATSHMPYAPDDAAVEIIPETEETEADPNKPGKSRRVGQRKLPSNR